MDAANADTGPVEVRMHNARSKRRDGLRSESYASVPSSVPSIGAIRDKKD
jgi:hypothetical protein